MNPALETLIPVAAMIANTVGPCCQAVLYDLNSPGDSVIYTKNAPAAAYLPCQNFGQFIEEVLRSQELKDDCSSNYVFTTDDGQTMKSSIAIIRDLNGKAIGALCVNLNITVLEPAFACLQELIGPLAAQKARGAKRQSQAKAVPMAQAAAVPRSPGRPPKAKSGAQDKDTIHNVQELVDGLIDKIMDRHIPALMTREEKIAIIRLMNEKGIFSIKGSVNKAAEKLNLSKVTIYSYLDEIRSRSQAGEK